MKKIVITSVLNRNGQNAGSKAKNDDRNILVNNGFVPLDIVVPEDRVRKLLFSKIDIPKLIKENNADEYIIQYPLYSMIVIRSVIESIKANNKNSKIILLIHDVEALRQRKGDQAYTNKEVQIFNEVDGIIVHNLSMKKYLKATGVHVQMIEQNLFDYLNDAPIKVKKEYNREICFAGNLSKAEFLNKLRFNKIRLNVYGAPKSKKIYKEGIFYKGSFDPDELPRYLEGDFGLVWDGDSCKTNTGIFGEYTRFNSPHKASLYLSTGIPVIVWDEAGIAPFIQENRLGIVVGRIDNLDEVLTKISHEEYQAIQLNVQNYAKKIRKGKNLLDSLRKMENRLFS
ncbi:sugar transferase [Ligilactobacillus araffinosus]|uniref:Galactofuranosyltransferase n=1 Tax=Ligilactobacillus araffinosus DSM 20653 TaxID=1423820 RepID=A0A0R1ZP80_9LACO|nr:sugar transferase [Ligilactobacillus araffinosus]KRM52611.1 hypothetical protein FC64_GL000362 [Ligilactobacillus araffinosus DSM 20653]